MPGSTRSSSLRKSWPGRVNPSHLQPGTRPSGRRRMIASKPISEAQRPRAITVVAGFLFLAAAISLLTGVSLLFPDPRWNNLWDLNQAANAAFRRMGAMPGILLPALGVVAGSAGIGMIRGKQWACWIAVSLFAINGLGDAFSLMVTRNLAKGGFRRSDCGRLLILAVPASGAAVFRPARSQ
jgi:hypothetical protein